MNNVLKQEHGLLESDAVSYGVREAIFLHEIFQKNHANEWIRLSIHDLKLSFPYMTGDVIRRTINSLESKNVIESKFDENNKFDRTKLYRLK